MTEADVDDNTSVWAATADPSDQSHEPLTGDASADVVVIGAGFTGLSTAWHLSHRFPHLGIVVVDAATVGAGASGRNGGMALHWINGVEIEDGERARRMYALTSETIVWIDGVIRSHGLDVGFRREGCLELLTSPRRADAARLEAERLSSFGLPIQFLEGPALDERVRATGAVGAVFDPTTGVLHGLRFVQVLARVLRARGVAIHERSPAVRITEGRTIVVETPKGSVRAPWMVLATNGYSARLGYFTTGVFPLHSHVIATEPLPDEILRNVGWGSIAGFTDDRARIAYASLTPDGRLLFGGGGNGAYSYYYGGRTRPPREPDAQFRYVRSVLERYFPGAAGLQIAHRWTGTLGLTLSRVCSIGVMGEHRNVLYGVGYSGHGVVLANLAGRVLCDLYADHHEPWRDLPFYQRPLRGIPPEPLRWLGYQAYTRATGRSPRKRATGSTRSASG